jgi:cytochrome c1
MGKFSKTWILAGIILIVLIATAAIGFQATSERRDLEQRASWMTGGNPHTGQVLARGKGCGGCHEIPGVKGAHGNVGPPLTKFASRMYVGGVLLNTPEHLHQWLLDPPSIDPKSAMPNVGLKDQEARDLAAYLYTLD